MSIYAMTAARVARGAIVTGDQSQFGSTLRDVRTDEPLHRDDLLVLLLRYTPTEIVGLYLAAVGFLPAIPIANDQRPLWEYDFRPRWLLFVGCLVLTPLVVAVAQKAQARNARQSFSWPFLEMVLATTAFAAWAIALPLAPVYAWQGWQSWAGSLLALFTLFMIGLVAKWLGSPLTYSRD